jgi:uncharacterized protein (TIGR02246 family)
MMSEKNKTPVTLAVNDEAAINQTLQNMCDAWACGDAGAYASLFIPDAVFVGVFGFRVVGSEAIGQRLQKVFNSIFKFSRIDIQNNNKIQALTPDVVLVHTDGNVLFPGEFNKKLKPHGLRTLSLVKQNGIWQIASFQNTPVGKFLTLQFMWRLLFSRVYLLNPTWKSAEKQTIAQKQKNIDIWKIQ